MSTLIDLYDVTKIFKVRESNKKLHAVDGLNLAILENEALGLVGESGSGKSTIGKMILRLSKPTSGTIFYRQKNLFLIPEAEMKKIRRELQIVFQNPYSSLNPRMSVEKILIEPLEIQQMLTKELRRERALELLKKLHLSEEILRRYPHQLSGGQRQRVGIARALTCEPRFIVLDEPLSALDATTQEQIIDLLKSLQDSLNLVYLFITHDLLAARKLCHRIAVIYLGKLVELAPSDKLFSNPLHPYTQALLSAIPLADPIKERKRNRIILKGEATDSLKKSEGCIFAHRCPRAQPLCHAFPPIHKEVSPGHLVACHFKLD